MHATAGWANNDGCQLFTIGWVSAAEPVEETVTSAGGVGTTWNPDWYKYLDDAKRIEEGKSEPTDEDVKDAIRTVFQPLPEGETAPLFLSAAKRSLYQLDGQGHLLEGLRASPGDLRRVMEAAEAVRLADIERLAALRKRRIAMAILLLLG